MRKGSLTSYPRADKLEEKRGQFMREPVLILVLDNGAEAHLTSVEWFSYSANSRIATVQTFGNQPADTRNVVRVRGEYREVAAWPHGIS